MARINGLSDDDLAKLYIPFSRVWRLLGHERSSAYRWQGQGRYPVTTVRELGVIYCYSVEVDGHMRGDHSLCKHAQPGDVSGAT